MALIVAAPSLGSVPNPSGGLGIDHRLGAAALRAPAASREDSRPQAILKLQPRNSFNYRVRYEPQLNCTYIFDPQNF